MDKKPFKWTRELIQLALNQGWTQTQIAKTCRTHQSVVSAWSKGEKHGTEQQLKPLLDLFGHKLRRKTFRLYWAINKDTQEKIFYKVEGRVILSHTLCDMRRAGVKLIKKIPEFKFIIHYQGNNTFRIILQSRIKFKYTNEELENSVDDAIWDSNITDIKTAQQVVDIIDELSRKEMFQKYPSDIVTLPFLVRKALLENGFSIEGIKEYPASW
ncbi:helix-turn-helix transcriptional regulator [Pasteurella multocida]|uniref:helix-turn-helix domain-containing protein n=1 Tax=Pasteurella multocida TaxID=747 RepID=UPI002B48F850|nr:helix-turn-helix transcriptional regulator [Pasteurella multocida]WRK08505.1 helix-turn-helix transcriptional regulator [Pasteurella multocida]